LRGAVFSVQYPPWFFFGVHVTLHCLQKVQQLQLMEAGGIE
jgi:hypothetical protein